MIRFWLSVLLIFSWSPAVLAQDFNLRFERFSPTKETSVGFSIHDGGTVPSAFLTGLGMTRTVETQRGLFILSVDTDTFEQHGTIFHFDVYVYTRNAAQIHKYVVSEDPIGPFKDGIFPVAFHIQTREGEDYTGSVDLPIHSNDGSDNLALDMPKNPLEIASGNASRSDLGLTNQLENLHVRVLETHISSITCENCWRSLSLKSNLDVLAPKKGTSLIFDRQPNTIKALMKSMFVLRPGVVHDTLLITVSSVSEQGGLQSPQEFRLPVTFTPPGAYLLLTILVGAALGGGLRLALRPNPATQSASAQGAGQGAAPAAAQPPPKERLPRLREFGVAVAIAIVFWVITLMLFSYAATQLKIFGLVMDPSQVPAAFLITLLAAGGLPVINKIKEIYNEFKEGK